MRVTLADRVRSSEKNGPRKHVFTDDDVAHSSGAAQTGQQNHVVDFQGDADAAQDCR